MSAEKLKRRPPLTTLATRLMWMTRSVSSSDEEGPCVSFELIETPIRKRSSENQAALAGTVGERLDAAVIDVAVAVEHDLFDALFEASVCERLTDLLGVLALVAVRGLLDLERGHGRDGGTLGVVDDLRVDLLVATEHGQT